MSETELTYLFLCGSALLAGAINSIAGGGTLLTFPALFAALNGNGVMANGTSTVAVLPGSLASSWGYRAELATKRKLLLQLIGPSLLGGGVGAFLVISFPQEVFNALVPWLILGAAVLFMLQKPAQRWIGAHKHEGPPSTRTVYWIVAFQFFVAIYGGYFGAGIGILMLSALGFMGAGDIHHMNGVKTVLAGGINGIAAGVFIFNGQVHWNYAIAMGIAAIIGGYLGARVARRLKAIYVRWIVIAIGFGLSAYYFWKQFG
ncbi:MAG: sulfite exporter TauE/SafE family protein [Planctomycetes bacterium]|nr:sulfite exporter TauE/SafE family protein [Planctomycetota bacterium]